MKVKNKLSKGWRWINLDEICKVKKGTSITKNKLGDGDIPVIAGGQQPAYYHNIANRKGKTITVSASGAYAGFVNYFDKLLFASDCTTIQSLDENKVLTKYIYLFLKSKQKKIYNFQSGAGQPHVYAKDLVKLEIPTPPLETQKQIVSILEKAEKLKGRRKKANEETNKIIQSIFYEMFGDPVKNKRKFEIKKLNEICDVRDGTHDSPKYKDKGFHLVTSKNIKDEFIDFSSAKLISREDLNKIEKRSKVDDGDIIMPMIGTIGNPIVIKKDRDFGIKNVALIKFKESKMSNVYIKYLLSGKYFNFISDSSNRGGTQKFIALKDIRNFPIPVPPIELQNKFAEQVKRVEKIKQHQQKSEQEINMLFDALMQKAFNGELVS